MNENETHKATPTTQHELLHYEICGAWWPPFVSWGMFQNLTAKYFVWKMERKTRRWNYCLHRYKSLQRAFTENDLEMTRSEISAKLATMSGAEMKKFRSDFVTELAKFGKPTENTRPNA